MSKKRVEGSWHCKPWCTKKHKYPKQQTTRHREKLDECSFDSVRFKDYKDLKGLVNNLVRDGCGCEIIGTKLIVRRVIDRKVKTNKFRLSREFYNLSAGEQIKKLQKSL